MPTMTTNTARVVSLEIPGIVVSLEISREVLFGLRQKYTWTSPGFVLDFPGLFLVFFLALKNRFCTNFLTMKKPGVLKTAQAGHSASKQILQIPFIKSTRK